MGEIGRGKGRKASCAVLVIALAALGFAGSASATLTGVYTVFEQCPRNGEAERCLYAKLTGGEVNIGGKAMGISNPSIMQVGFNEGEEGEPLPIVPAANGETMSKAPQPVSDGLLSLMPSKTAPALKGLWEAFAKSPLNRLSTTMEIAGPENSLKLSYQHLAEGLGTAFELPAKLHLESPLLGKKCYIGSNSAPIVFDLTVGMTDPPPPNLPISGSGGSVEFLDGGRILEAAGGEMVDNAFSVPKAHGCGLLMDPLINKQMGLPSPAGRNTVILKATSMITTVFALDRNDEENP